MADLSGPVSPFDAGTVVERREVVHGRTWLTTPVTVVDDGEVLAVRLDPGAPMTFPPHPFGRHPWSGRRAWGDTTVLQLHRPHDWYAVWRMFRDGRDLGWYINFEAPIVRRHRAFETLDYGVDITVAPDGTWEWKDLDDPGLLVLEGRLTASLVEELTGHTTRVAALLDTGNWWWSAWDDWAP